jgi:hypothetical protein
MKDEKRCLPMRALDKGTTPQIATPSLRPWFDGLTMSGPQGRLPKTSTGDLFSWQAQGSKHKIHRQRRWDGAGHARRVIEPTPRNTSFSPRRYTGHWTLLSAVEEAPKVLPPTKSDRGLLHKRCFRASCQGSGDSMGFQHQTIRLCDCQSSQSNRDTILRNYQRPTFHLFLPECVE